MTAIACGWLEDGTVARLEGGKRRDARLRQAIAGDVLPGLRLVRHPSSYFAWLGLPAEVRAQEVVTDLAREGVWVSTAEPFTASGPAPQAIRLALGSVPIDTLRSALTSVRRVIGAYGA
jgi:DNA-binding transcriptional MocR family regulator